MPQPHLAAAAAPELPDEVVVTTARGYTVGVTPGLLDDDARYLYRNGQCVALATELARALGVDHITAVLDEEDTLLHASVVKGDSAYDVYGEHDPAGMEESYGVGADDYEPWEDGGPRTEQFYLVDGEDEDDPETLNWVLRRTNLGPQNFDLARSFVPAVLEECGLNAPLH